MIAGRVTRVVNPRKRSAPRKKASARPNHRRRSVNPAYLMTLGPMINPKRSSRMAKKRKNKKSYARRPKLNSYARRNKKNAKKSRALTTSRVAAFAKSHGMKVTKKRSNRGRSRNPLASSISLSRPSGIVQACGGSAVSSTRNSARRRVSAVSRKRDRSPSTRFCLPLARLSRSADAEDRAISFRRATQFRRIRFWTRRPAFPSGRLWSSRLIPRLTGRLKKTRI